MKRKLLSVLMALCLILTLLPTAVFAEELTPPEESGEQQEEQIKEPSTPEKEPDDPEKEQEGEEDLQPSDGDPELPAGDGEDERDPQTPEDGVQDPTGEEIPENGSTSVPNEVPLQEIILLEESAVTMEQNGGTTEYDSVSAAIDATQAYNKDTNKGLYTITLNENLAEDVVIPEGRYIKIDLNGHTLTNKESHTIFNNSTRITIVDTSAEKTGVVDNISHGRGAVYNNINAAITLQGGTYTRSQEASTGSDASGSNSWYVLKNFGTMTIKDGVTVKFSDSNSGLYSSLIGNGWQNSSAAENGVDPVVGWLVCVKGPYYGQSFPLKSGKNRIGRAQSMDVRLLNDSSVSRDCVAVIVYDAKIGDFSVIPGDSDSLCYWNEAAVYAREQLTAYDTLELGDSGRNAFIFVPLCGERFSWADRQSDETRRD